MTPTEAERIGRAWLTAGGEWLPGMLAQVPWSVGGSEPVWRPARIVDAPNFPGQTGYMAGVGCVGLAADCWPDPRDAATVGCMLAIVRARWDDPGAYCVIGGGSPEIGVWHVHITRRNYDTGASHPVSRRGPTEAEALVAALVAAPKGAKL